MLTDKKKKVLDFYNKGLELYKKRLFKEALDFFSQASEVDPEDGPAKLYVTRCKTYIKTPPPADWDGVFVMTSK
ncbi:MAG: hypothetical protein KAR07_07235 [Spirochaetes bacterium]|nr:hypothetical protein [Spirochaetota bacterium]MCK5267942.1 hypothetical protein [Spirochaetota bacterium]